MILKEDADQYIVYRMFDSGVLEALQSLGIAENQFADKLGKEIGRSFGQT